MIAHIECNPTGSMQNIERDTTIQNYKCTLSLVLNTSLILVNSWCQCKLIFGSAKTDLDVTSIPIFLNRKVRRFATTEIINSKSIELD